LFAMLLANTPVCCPMARFFHPVCQGNIYTLSRIWLIRTYVAFQKVLPRQVTNDRIPREPQEKSHPRGPWIAPSSAYELSEPGTTRFPFFSVPTRNARLESLIGY